MHNHQILSPEGTSVIYSKGTTIWLPILENQSKQFLEGLIRDREIGVDGWEGHVYGRD